MANICDQVLTRIVPESSDDEIALIAVRCPPQGTAKPASSVVSDLSSTHLPVTGSMP